MASIKVCIVTTAFPRYADDGRGSFVLEAARAICAQGAAVRVIAMHSPDAKTHEMIDTIEVIRPRYLWPECWEVLQKEGGGLPIVWRKHKLARLAVIPFGIAHMLAVIRHARDCDVIHANWTLSAAAVWAGQCLHRRPFIVTVQGSDIFQATRLPLVSRLTAVVLKRCRRVLALSRSLADAVVALGIPSDHIEIVPNGVDVDKLQADSSKREALILFVGSLIERKGVTYLLQALPPVLKALPGYRLAIVGEGPQHAELVRLATALGVADQVDFVGPQTQAQVGNWMRRAKVLVLPSLEEGLGVVLLEALASGTPCIGSNVGGIPDVIGPEVGRLVPPANAAALAQAIMDVLHDDARWHTLSHNARLLAVERFDWKVIGARLMRIYREVGADIDRLM